MSAGISALSSNLTIAVLLYEIAIANIVHICSFETIAILIFLDSSTITSAILKGALEL